MGQPEGSRPEKSASVASSQASVVHHAESPGTNTTNQDELYEAAPFNEPPPYSGPATPSASTQIPPVNRNVSIPGLPKIDFALYSPRTFRLSDDQTSITSHDLIYSSQPAALVNLVRKLAAVPPKPQIRIQGESRDGMSTVDFDIRINMMSLIISDDSRRSAMNYLKVIAPGEEGFRGDWKPTTGPHYEGGLEEWARKYCQDQNSIKEFVLERSVINWDTSYLEGRILALVSSTNYKGQVSVTFPITHARVVVQPPHKVNKFFSSVTKAFTGTRKYRVVQSIWPYASSPRQPDAAPGSRSCLAQSEERWFQDWRETIRMAISSGAKRWLSFEDRLEFLMEPSRYQNSSSQ